MAGLERRLERLEHKNPRHADEETGKRHWLAMAKARRNHENHDRDEFHAHDIFRVLRLQGRLGTTAGEIRDQLLSWRPPPSERAVERVLARAIFDQEKGAENMACPPEWREAFAAADELLERYAGVPDETLAGWIAMQHQVEQEDPRASDLKEQIDAEANSYGITEDLILRAVGPDAEEIAEEETQRRLREILADLYYGERGYRVQLRLAQMGEKA
jgi:hypothetical protein